jgi:hypothetical protein
MKAVSIMLTLVVDADNRKLYQEVEIVWEDGTVRNLTIEAHKSLRIDIDTLYQRPSIQPPTPE